jgi:hypothetical protein
MHVGSLPTGRHLGRSGAALVSSLDGAECWCGPDIKCHDSGVECRVELLSSDSPLIDTVVQWHWDEWSSDHDHAEIDGWRAGVRERTNLDRVPFTLVAHLDGEPVGCLSVSDDDIDERFADRGPWLSGMLVVARARNLGVGRALVVLSIHVGDVGGGPPMR